MSSYSHQFGIKGWNTFKPEVEQLASSLRGNSDLLQKQQLRMKAVHAFPAPVWTLSDGLSVKVLRKSRTSNPLYGELNSDVLKVSHITRFPFASIYLKTSTKGTPT